MSLRFCHSNIAVLISTHSIIGIHLPLVVNIPRNTRDFIPCFGVNINAFQRYHFVLKGVVVDLLVNVKKAVALKELSTFLEELRSKSVNLRTRDRLHTSLLAANDAGYRVD
jgi:hypothetical protein